MEDALKTIQQEYNVMKRKADAMEDYNSQKKAKISEVQKEASALSDDVYNLIAVSQQLNEKLKVMMTICKSFEKEFMGDCEDHRRNDDDDGSVTASEPLELQAPVDSQATVNE